MKRAKKNLKIAITQNDWIAKEYKLEELYSTICHLNSLEHYKVTKDTKDLFVLKEKKSYINTICDENLLQELSNHDVNSIFEPVPWRPKDHSLCMVIQLVNKIVIQPREIPARPSVKMPTPNQRTYNLDQQRTSPTKNFKKPCILCSSTFHENNVCPAAGSISDAFTRCGICKAYFEYTNKTPHDDLRPTCPILQLFC